MITYQYGNIKINSFHWIVQSKRNYIYDKYNFDVA